MKKTALLCKLIFFISMAFANNVQVTAVSYNAGSHQVLFTLAWENSWDLAGAPGNHDAVWVFVKYQAGSENWSHAQVSTSPASHTLGSSLTLAQPAAMNSYGVLIKRGVPGFGNIDVNNTVSLQLTTPAGITAIQVFAIEMVYITGGSYEIGRANHGNAAFKDTTIQNENMLPAGSLVSNPLDIPAEFPKGFNAFYVMKYEISQGQYTDFLNTLTRAQQGQRVATDISGTAVTNRYVMTNQAALTNFNHIMCPATLPATARVAFTCGVPEKACNYLSWADLAGYLDWAGLRPFTEMEFEKICRGFDARTEDQTVWGADYVFGAVPEVMTAIDADLPTETNTMADPAINLNNAGNISMQGNLFGRLMRCGFPGNKPTNRALSGATYFGVMEMAGNAGEFVVMVLGNGRLFTGNNGNGDVSDAPVSWPDYITTGIDVGMRGGHYRSVPLASQIYPRYVVPSTDFSNNVRTYYMGGRGALSL